MENRKVFFSTSYQEGFRHLEDVVRMAISIVNRTSKYKVTIQKLNDFQFGLSSLELMKYIQESDIVINNIFGNTSNFMYELGITHGLNKPSLILLDNDSKISFDISKFRFVNYSSENLNTGNRSIMELYSQRISNVLLEMLDNPDEWIIHSLKKSPQKVYKTVFVSYCHKDNLYLERLKIHLKPIERKSAMQLWSDTLIKGGEKWKQEIQTALKNSAIAILLISADFLASDFIVDNELQPLLKAAEEKGTIIIPVILKPCRFLREQSISQFQAINNPAIPLCKMDEFSEEEVYEKIAQRIELALESEV